MTELTFVDGLRIEPIGFGTHRQMLAVGHFSAAEEGRKLAWHSVGCFDFGLAEHG